MPTVPISVIACDEFGNEVHRFKSSKEANIFVGANPNRSLKTIIQKHYFSNGYYWKYVDDKMNENIAITLKSQHIIAINVENSQLTKMFKSYREAAQMFHADVTTIQKYINNQEVFNGYILTEHGSHKEPNLTEQHLEKLRKRVGGSSERNGKIEIEFESALAASKHFNKCKSAISTAINQGYKCANYYWRYI